MNDDLILKVSGSTDELTIKDFFTGGDNADINISFADGGSISATELLGLFKSSKTPLIQTLTAFTKHLMCLWHSWRSLRLLPQRVARQ